MKPISSYYRKMMNEQENPLHLQHTEKQVRKYIPPEIHLIFENGLNLPNILMHENHRQMGHVEQLQDLLSQSERSAHTIKQSLPPSTSLWDDLSKYFTKVNEPDGSADEDSSDDDKETHDALEKTIQALTDAHPEVPSDDGAPPILTEAVSDLDDGGAPSDEEGSGTEYDGGGDNTPLEGVEDGGTYYMQVGGQSFF